jgi:hypothetical protein
MNRTELPRFIFFDLPNLILAGALILLSGLPFLALTLQQGLKVRLLDLLPEGSGLVLAAVAFLFIKKWPNARWPHAMMVSVIVVISLWAIGSTWNDYVANPPGTPVCPSGFKPLGKPIKDFSSEDPYVLARSPASIDDLIHAIGFELDRELDNHCLLPQTLLVVGVGKENKNGLALARANRIKETIGDRLLQKEKFLNVWIDYIAAGPSRDDPRSHAYNAEEAERDGSVTVYGVWGVKPMEGSEPAR